MSGLGFPLRLSIVVLGCRVRFGGSDDCAATSAGRPACGRSGGSRPNGEGRTLVGALGRRIDAAAAAYFESAPPQRRDAIVVVSGGRRWGEAVEADEMARELVRRGVPAGAIVRERCSLSTSDNARFTAALLARRGIRHARLVTCPWHMRRALALFRRAGVDVEARPSAPGEVGVRARVWRWGRERLLTWALAYLSGCSASSASHPSAKPDAGGLFSDPIAVIARAEDLRRARDLPAESQASHDVTVRRAAARALARILDGDDGPLLRALQDDDPQVVGWAAFGLGESCKGREESHARAIAARLASGGEGPAVVTMLRALGRCAGDLAEQTLRGWLYREVAPGSDAKALRDDAEAAAFALGEIAARRRAVSSESIAALLEAARGSPPLDEALYPFGRTDGALAAEVRRQVAQAARAALARAGPARVFAVRALARAADANAAGDLAKVLASNDYTPAERVGAAQGLARLRGAGQDALAEVLGTLVPSRTDGLRGDRFGVLMAALDAVGDDPSEQMEAALWSVGRLEAPPDAQAALLRRASLVRCLAAEKLARGAWDSDVLARCDLADGSAREIAQLAALDRGTFGRSKKNTWARLAGSPHVRVREAALKVVVRHPELGDAGVAAIADALEAPQPGVVATAADVVQGHPDRVLVLAASEKRAALDPRAPPPATVPARVLSPAVVRALAVALARPWSEDLVETRASVLEAALTVGLPEARAAALAACKDRNQAIRSRAAKALAGTGDKDPVCPAPDSPIAPAPELGALASGVERIVFDTDAGSLALRLDPSLAPIAVTRIVALARSGFYTGVVVHRIVPGFVVQLGDRGGDGFGGSGALMRCETSPTPFAPFDVGVALAGRDTGSSQFFVTLARYPHLDGEYAWLGRAEGDWNEAAEGDVVTAVRVDP